LDVVSQQLVSIDDNDNPLLDNVGVKRVFLVVNQAFLKVSKGLQPQIFEFILDANYLLKKDEKLPVSFGLEIFQSLEHQSIQNY